MGDLLTALLAQLPKLTVTAAVDVLAVAFLLYQFILIVRGRRSAPVLTGIAILVLIYLIAVALHLELLRTILAALAPYTIFALIVMFQSELRRLLARLGRRRAFGASPLERRELADEILLAVSQLSQQQIGGLIVVERNIGLRTFVESGVAIDARLSRDLIVCIFHPGGLLHDGAVIVQGDRIAAAACFLPLTTNPALSSQLGTRHRAAIGITEEADCLSIVVSEETGRISLAALGEIELDVTLDRVREVLTSRNPSRDLRSSDNSAQRARRTTVEFP
jgi:diadenylate cyclase